MEGEGSRISKKMRYTYSSGGKDKACFIFYCHDDFTGGNLTRIECNICIVDLKSDIPVGTLDDDVDLKSDNTVGVLGDVADADDDEGDDERDFDDEEYDYDKTIPRVRPTIQIDCGGHDFMASMATDAFCVVDGRLYMFAGIGDDKTEKSVFAFDLSQITLNRETTKLEKDGSLLEKKIGDMLSPKTFPAALPTPDGGKIVVFPTAWPRLDAEADESTISCGGFELFDPANPQSPQQLPPITGVYGSWIEHYGFIENSDQLLIQVSCRGMYYLDLASSEPDKRWVKLDVFYSNLERIPIHVVRPSLFETVEKRQFCFVNRWGLCDLQDIVDGRDVEILTAPREEDYTSRGLHFGRLRDVNVDRRAARCLSDQDKDGKYHCCEMLMQRPESQTESCRVAIAVCCFDLKSYMENVMIEADDQKREHTKVVKNHRIVLCFEGKRRLSHGTHLFFTF